MRTARSANDRLKEGFGSRLWASMIAATVLHFVIFALAPTMLAEDISVASADLNVVEVPDVELPDPPESLERPAPPVATDADIDEDVTIESTVFDAHPVEELPPPPPEASGETSGLPAFTPYTVAPSLTNVADVRRAMAREYPEVLRNAGVGGRVLLHVHVGAGGGVLDARVHESSGYEALDRAALAVADAMEFSPAMNRDREVAVWIQQSVVFEVR